MNKELVQAARSMFSGVGVGSILDIDREIQRFKNEHPQFSGVSNSTIKILVTSLKFKEDEKAANTILMSLIHEADVDGLVMIFSKVTEYSAEFLDYCREYAGVKQLRPVISEIFNRLGMTCEEAHAYALTGDAQDESTVASLLKSLNSADFKRTRKAVRLVPVGKYVHLLPELSEQGIRNLREICGSDVLKYLGGSPSHNSEIVRVEYFKGLESMQEILDFFRINQFINDKSNQLDIAKSLESKLAKLSKRESFGQFVQGLYSNMALKMCRSPNLQRRHLGTLLLLRIMPFVEPNDSKLSVIYDLIHDKSHDIRSMASVHCNMVRKNDSVHIGSLFSHQLGRVAGGAMFLRDRDPRTILDILKLHVESGSTAIHGLLHCLNVMDFRSHEYSALIDDLYSAYTPKVDSMAGWKILKECCIFYHRSGRIDVLMDALLSTSHLGMICLLRDLIDLTNLSDSIISSYILKGIEEIKEKGTNTRKSGGLPLYFVLLIRNKKNYPVVRQKLYELIADDSLSSPGSINLRGLPESTLFHALNVLIAIFDSTGQEDVSFYLDIGLSCFSHSSFSIKNCGCTLLSSIFKKVLLGQKSFNSLFTLFREMRRTVQDRLEKSIQMEDSLLAYYILFIYERTNSLQAYEMDLIRRCMTMGGLVKLKAEKILSWEFQGSSYSSEPPRQVLRFSKSLDEKTILLKALLMLNSSDLSAAEAARSYLQVSYDLPKASNEYTIHLVSELARMRGYGSFIRGELEAVQASRECDPSCADEEEDIGYVLELFG